MLDEKLDPSGPMADYRIVQEGKHRFVVEQCAHLSLGPQWFEIERSFLTERGARRWIERDRRRQERRVVAEL